MQKRSKRIDDACRIYRRLPRKGVDFKKELKSLGYQFDKNMFLAAKSIRGDVNVIVEALHGFRESGHAGTAEIRTAKIAHLASALSGAGCVLALRPRSVVDLNRSGKARFSVGSRLDKKLQKAGAEFYPVHISGIVGGFLARRKSRKLFLIVSVHGMRDRKMREIDVGSGRGKLCRKSIALWFGSEMRKKLRQMGLNFRVNVDRGFTGGAHPKILREPKFLGKNVQYLQVEFNKKIRKNHAPQLSAALAAIIDDFAAKNWAPKRRNRKRVFRKRVIRLEGKIKVAEFRGRNINNVYIDRSQRVSLKTRRGSIVKMLVGKVKTVDLQVHQAKYFQIGENKIVLNRKLVEKLNLKEGNKITIINSINYEKIKGGNP